MYFFDPGLAKVPTGFKRLDHLPVLYLRLRLIETSDTGIGGTMGCVDRSKTPQSDGSLRFCLHCTRHRNTLETGPFLRTNRSSEHFYVTLYEVRYCLPSYLMPLVFLLPRRGSDPPVNFQGLPPNVLDSDSFFSVLDRTTYSLIPYILFPTFRHRGLTCK